MITQTYCGGKYYAGTEEFACGQRDEPCRKCLKRHIARLEAALAYKQTMLEGAEKEIRQREDKDKVYRIRVDLLEAHVAELEAQAAAQAGGVVVPDDVHATMLAHGADGTIMVCGEKANGVEFRAKFQVVPASRVLGEGEIKGTPEELAGIAKDAAYKWMGDSSPSHALIHCIEDALRAQAAEGGA